MNILAIFLSNCPKYQHVAPSLFLMGIFLAERGH
jgi:hypothetical protein